MPVSAAIPSCDEFIIGGFQGKTMKNRLLLSIALLVVLPHSALSTGISPAEGGTLYVYKGQKTTWTFITDFTEDINGDGLYQGVSYITLVDRPDLQWASLEHDYFTITELRPPQGLPIVPGGVRHLNTVFMNTALLKAGFTYAFQASACSEPPIGGGIGTRTCVIAGPTSVVVLPWPIVLSGATGVGGSLGEVLLEWTGPASSFGNLHHVAVYSRSDDSVRISQLGLAVLVRDSLDPVVCSVRLSRPDRKTNPFYAVVGFDSTGEPVAISQSRQISLSSGPFSLMQPLDGDVLASTTPVFQWGTAGASSYELWISGDSSFAAPTIVTGIASQSYTPSVPLPDNSVLYWKVKTDGGVWSTQTGWRFSTNAVNALPGQPVLLAPGAGTLLTSRTPSFRWSAAPDPGDTVTYRMVIATDQAFLSPFFSCSTRDTFWNGLYPPLANGTYYWQVTALDGQGDSAVAPQPFSFTVDLDDPPGIFTLIFPRANWRVDLAELPVETSLTPEFSWSRSLDPQNVGPITYTIEYATNAAFEGAAVVAGITDTVFTPSTPLLEDRQYYWRVTAFDPAGQSRVNGPPFSFATNAEPCSPGVFAVTPSNDEPVNPDDVVVRWTPPIEQVWGYETYAVMYSRDSTFTTDTTVVRGIFNVEAYRLPLLVPGRWFVQVTGEILDLQMNSCGSFTSDTVSFIARGQYISKVNAPNGGEAWRVGSTRTITWTSVDVDSVRIELTRDSGVSWEVIGSSVPGPAGQYPWTVTGPFSTTCRVKVTATGDSTLHDVSDADFAIVPYPVWYVAPFSGDPVSDGTALHPFPAIQQAVDIASATDSIRVAGGIYNETVSLADGMGLIVTGGYVPGTWERDPAGHPSIIVPVPGGYGFYVPEGSAGSPAVIDGFTVRNAGAAFYRGGTPSIFTTVIRNCIVEDCNRAGLFSFVGLLTIDGVRVVRSNEGFLFHWPASVVLTNCVFDSIATWAIYAYNISGTVRVRHSTFRRCDRGVLLADGGASNHWVLNSIFSNCRQGISYTGCSAMDIRGNLFWETTTPTGTCTPDSTNIFADPQFVDTTLHDLRLRLTSPAIGRGVAGIGPPTDREGDMRPNPPGSRPDIGAYESVGATPASTASFTVDPSWNLLSIPLEVYDFRTSTLFPTAVSPAFGFTQGYIAKDTMQCGQGYWLKFASGESVSLTGQLLSADTVAVKPGWNLVGSIATAVDVGSITSVPPGLTVSPFYGYAAGYVTVTALEPFKGYWVKAAEEGTLLLGASGGGAGAVNIVQTQDLPPAPPVLSAVDGADVPTTVILEQNYPNPFNPSTVIRYGLPAAAHVDLTLYNALGQRIAVLVSGVKTAGFHEVTFHTNGLASGAYFCKLDAGGVVQVKRLLLLR